MRRRLGRALAAAVGAAVLAAAPPAGAQDEADDGDHLVVVQQTPWVVPGGTFALRVRIEDAPEGGTIRLAVHSSVRNRSEFARTLEGRGLRGVVSGGRREWPLDGLTADTNGAVALRVPTGDLLGEQPVTRLRDEGVYPVVVELLDGDDEVVDRIQTEIVRLPAPDPDIEHHPLQLAVVVPVHAQPSHLEPGRVDVDRLARLDVTLDALAAAGDRQVVATTWVRLDAGAWSGSLADELDRQFAAGAATIEAVTGRPPDSDTWVAPSDIEAADVRAMAARGVTTMVLPEASLEPLSGDDFPLTLTRPFRIPTSDDDTVGAVVADAALGAHHGATGDPLLDAHHLLADAAVLALDQPASLRGAVVVLDDAAAADAPFLESLLADLGRSIDDPGAAELVEPVTIDDIVTEVDPAEVDDEPLVRELAPVDAPAAGVGRLAGDLALARGEITSYRSVFGNDAPLAAAAEDVVLTAGAAGLDGSDRADMLDRTVAALRGDLDGIIGPPPGQRVTLTAREGKIQLQLGNDTGRAADINLELRGDRLEFPGHPDGRVPVRLAPGATTLDLDVRARSSGDATLDLRLTTPDGRLQLAESRVTVRSTAFSGVGLVLMGAAAAFLVVWWTRTILRERGARRRPRHAR